MSVMLRRGLLVVGWLSAASVMLGFVQPWALLDVREPSMMKKLREASPVSGTLGGITKDVGRIAVKIRRGAKTVTGDLPSLSDIPRQVSGVQIPQMANSEHAKVVTAIFELFMNEHQQVGAKSYAVYVVPGLALVCALLLTLFSGRGPVLLGVAVVGALIASVGFYKVLTTNTQTLFVAITIGRGIWISLWGYTGLALAGAGLGALTLTRGRR